MKNFKRNALILLGIICKSAFGQQSIDAYITDSTKNNLILIANSSNSLVSPIDLDFFPDQIRRPNELWILNQGTYSSGGSTEIIFDANKSSRTYKYVKDGNSWHFMALASAIAFGDSNWSTSGDILDANRQGGTYSGPTLWPGDLSIYGIVGNPSSQTTNGSHLSMIHQTPYGKGIAFERDNVYWVLDGFEGTIKRYDFGLPHLPGGADHSGGGVRVYPEFKFTKHSTLPSHIVIDDNRKYLYGCDPVGKRIFRIDITTGTNSGIGTKVNNEILSLGYFKYTGLSIIDTLIKGLINPVGIDIYGDRLIVTDNGSDEIIIFDIRDNYTEIGRIKLKYAVNPDPMGIKIGPDGKIYFVDKLNKRAYMIDNSSVFALGVNEIRNSENIFSIYPNPTGSNLNIQIKSEVVPCELIIMNSVGEIFKNELIESLNSDIDLSVLNNGIYILHLKYNNQVFSQKFIKQ